MKHWFVFFLALASVGSVKGQQTITLSNGNMVAGAYKQPPTRTVKSVDDGYIITYTFDKATVIDDPLYKGSIMWKVAGFGEEYTPRRSNPARSSGLPASARCRFAASEPVSSPVWC